MRNPSQNLPFAYSNPLPFPLPSGCPGRSMVNNLSIQEKQEMQVQSLGQEDTLEKEMGSQPSILAWKSHGHRRLVGYILVTKNQTQLSKHAHA